MTIKVAINGFGRIGRLTFRNLVERKGEFEVVWPKAIATATLQAPKAPWG